MTQHFAPKDSLMVSSLGDFYGIDPIKFAESGALDPILGVDTRLFIDPSLVKLSKISEFAESFDKVRTHFSDVLKLVRNIEKPDDVFWRKADKLLSFPEVQGLCIGYSSEGVAGKGMGVVKLRRLLETMTQIVRAGMHDPTIFELVGAFEDGIGPDLISDMIAKIIMPDLITFTQRVCSDLGIPMEALGYSKLFPPEDLPFHPASKQPIILVPQEFLRDLPVAETYADIFWVANHNAKLRDELNLLIVGPWREPTTKQRKDRLKATFVQHPEALAEVIRAYEHAGAQFYDFADDPAGEVVWYRAAKRLPSAAKLHLELPQRPHIDQVFEVVEKICVHFKALVEDNQLARLLYDKGGKRKYESASQLVFFGVASAYCEANNLDLSPEADSGRGPVDFKVSRGFEGKVLVEIKLTSNYQLLKGFQKQLPIYQKAEKALRGIYLVIDVGGITEERSSNFRDAVKAAGKSAPTVIYVNAAILRSASKASDEFPETEE